MEQFDQIKDKLNGEKEFVVSKLEEVRSEVKELLSKETSDLKEYTKDVTDKQAAKSTTLQQKYAEKLDGIKDVCA